MASPRLQQRIDVFSASLLARDLSEEDGMALRERLLAASTYADLSDADRELLRRGVLAWSDGAGIDLGAVSRGDFAAIDAALDSGDTAQLEAALDTVAAGPYGYGEAPLSDEWPVAAEDEDDDDDLDPDAELEAREALDEKGWVGL